MEYSLFYFSGTGNSLDAAQQIASTLQEDGHDARLYSMEESATKPRGAEPGTSFDGDDADVIVLIFPVYAGSPPAVVLRLSRSVPKARRKAVIVAVDGGDGLRAAQRATRALSRRGCDVFYSARLGYPDNWTQMMEPPSPEEAEKEIEAGRKGARQIARDVASGSSSHYRPNGGGIVLFNAIGCLFRLVGRRYLGQFYAATGRCTICRLCERVCPVGAITIPRGKNARPGWNARCESCNRCINVCPEGAIVTAPGRMILILAPIGVSAYGLVRLFNAYLWPAVMHVVPASRTVHGVIVTVLILVAHGGYFVFPGPLYRLLFRLPGLGALMSLGFNENWNRYRFPGYRPPRHRDRLEERSDA